MIQEAFRFRGRVFTTLDGYHYDAMCEGAATIARETGVPVDTILAIIDGGTEPYEFGWLDSDTGEFDTVGTYRREYYARRAIQEGYGQMVYDEKEEAK